MDQHSFQADSPPSSSPYLYFSRGSLTPEQFSRMSSDIKIASVSCSVYVVLQGLAIIYSILRSINKSKTNA